MGEGSSTALDLIPISNRGSHAMSSHQQREVVHVALGSAACHVSAHWLNLQGLAATAGGEDADGQARTCSPATTHFAHALSGHNDAVYVPRAILVDDKAASASPPNLVPQQQQQQQQQQHPLHFPTWGGAVETIHVLDRDRAEVVSSRIPDQFRIQAAHLAYGTYSRYRVPQQQSQQQQSYASSDGRQVNWDDEEDEPDEDDLELLRIREQQKQQEWQRHYRPTQEALEDFWNVGGFLLTSDVAAAHSSPSSVQELPAPTSSPEAATSPPPLQMFNPHSLWRDYLMPPYHPQTCLDAPSVSDFDSTIVRSYYTAQQQQNSDTWIEDVLWERVRKLLEDCDACQGLVIVQSGGVFAGWGTSVLREWQDECPNTCRLVVNISDDDIQEQRSSQDLSPAASTTTTTTKNTKNNKQQKIRQQVQRALQLSDQSELADTYLPLQLPSNDVAGAALTAAALESATLPFRVNSPRSMIGLQSYYSGTYSGAHPYGTTSSLSFREFVRSLQRQSAARNVLELDVLEPSHCSGSDLYTRLRQGTSLERDHRMRQPGYDGGIHRGRDILPGEWMMENDGKGKGLLSSLSPHAANWNTKNGDRSLHHHYALSTSLRPSSKQTNSNYVTCIMEGMGIRYRPEQSMATVVDQSLSQLTTNGYGAGSYWKSIFTNKTHRAASFTTIQSVSILAMLGNSTRVYPYLHQTAIDVQEILLRRNQRSINRAFYNRDAVQGILPEADDSNEAVSACW